MWEKGQKITMRQDKVEKLVPVIMFFVMLVSFILAIVLAVTGWRASVNYKRVLLLISSVFLFAISGLSIAYLALLREKDPNFFLYDTDIKGNISVGQLTFEKVSERMDYYLTNVLNTTIPELWEGDLLAEDNHPWGQNGVYRPLIVYKMLYELTVEDNTVEWSYVENASRAKIALVIRALEQGNDTDLARAIVYLYNSKVEEGENMRDFLTCNQKSLRGRMLKYVKNNLEAFYSGK